MIFLYAAKVREQRVEQRLLVDGSTEHIVETGAAAIIREYPGAITSTGGRPSWPNPSGTSTGGNHRSHFANSPASYSVRDAGSAGANNGRNC